MNKEQYANNQAEHRTFRACIAHALAHLREANKLQPKDVAENSDLGASKVSQMENHAKLLTIDNIRSYARAIGVNASEVIALAESLSAEPAAKATKKILASEISERVSEKAQDEPEGGFTF